MIRNIRNNNINVNDHIKFIIKSTYRTTRFRKKYNDNNALAI